MEAEKIVELISGYYCVFRGNPIHCTPYAMFATLQQAIIHVRKLGLDGPLSFQKWLYEFKPPESPDKPLWQD